MTYGEAIKQICKEKGMLLQDVERNSGVCVGFIRTQKENMNLKKLDAIAKTLGVKPQRIVDMVQGNDDENDDVKRNTIIHSFGTGKTIASLSLLNYTELSEDEKMIIEAYRKMKMSDKLKLYAQMYSMVED